MKHVPNALTLLRLVLAPVIAWLMWEVMIPSSALNSEFSSPLNAADYIDLRQRGATICAIAAVLFIAAALTDLFDGMIARAFNAHSKFGRLIDPIADKALVGLPLVVISVGTYGSGFWPIIASASAVIILRDIGMTLIRLRASDGEGARVSFLAKIKTALELTVIGSLLVVLAVTTHLNLQAALEGRDFMGPPFADVLEIGWLALLVITAALSAYTALQYLRPKPKR